MLILRDKTYASTSMLVKQGYLANKVATGIRSKAIAAVSKKSAKGLYLNTGNPTNIAVSSTGSTLTQKYYPSMKRKVVPSGPKPKQLDLFPGQDFGPISNTNRRIINAGKKTTNRSPWTRSVYEEAPSSTKNTIRKTLRTDGSARVEKQGPTFSFYANMKPVIPTSSPLA